MRKEGTQSTVEIPTVSIVIPADPIEPRREVCRVLHAESRSAPENVRYVRHGYWEDECTPEIFEWLPDLLFLFIITFAVAYYVAAFAIGWALVCLVCIAAFAPTRWVTWILFYGWLFGILACLLFRPSDDSHAHI